MSQLIKELKNGQHIVHDLFGATSNVTIDMSEYVLAGHSFGGQTAVATAASLPDPDKPKALFALDPSLYAYADEILAGQYQVTCPVLMIHSEWFTHYANTEYK